MKFRIKRVRDSLAARCWRIQQKRRIKEYESCLAQILGRHPPNTKVIVFPPGLGWSTQLFQRPQQLALALSRRGVLVFYMEPEHGSSLQGFQQLQENLYLCRIPIESFRILPKPLVYALTWNVRFAQRFQQAQIIYDYVDDLSAFAGNQPVLQNNHQILLSSARVVLATSELLYKEAVSVRPNALLCPNGVDYDHFAFAESLRDMPPPSDLGPILGMGKKVVGYYGALAPWFDYELLEMVAQKRGDLVFVLIGPEYERSLSASSLLHLANVHWLGEKKYIELPAYLHCFDVAVIPFRLSRLTHAVSPIKLFEYMAGGKPIVATPMTESMRIKGVLFAQNADEFSNQIDKALSLSRDLEYQRLIQQAALQNTWDMRARQILDALDKI
jgi:glycosyltransferase involved in cell wall biosynthesis